MTALAYDRAVDALRHDLLPVLIPGTMDGEPCTFTKVYAPTPAARPWLFHRDARRRIEVHLWLVRFARGCAVNAAVVLD